MKHDLSIHRGLRLSCHGLLGVALAAALLGGCANPATTSAELGQLRQMDQVLQQSSPGAAVALEVVSPQVVVGQTVGLRVGSAKPGYLYVFHIGTNGKDLSMSFPNAMDGANHMAGGPGVLALPRANWQLSAKGPAGTGYFMALVTERQQDLMRLGADVSQGRIAVVGAYGAATATLREVAP